MSLSLGIDVGSTTLKVVLLNEENEIIYKSYERHKSMVRPLCVQKIKELKPLLENHETKIAITGSAGIGIANGAGLAFVQEVFANAVAVKKYYPQTNQVIELGGEDAKIIFLQGSIEERMNSTCAGGTGAFIDQMASLLDIDLETMDKLSLNYDRLYPIASRCGVFAKSDIQPLMNQGVSKENISASIFQAVVEQSITTLAQGRKIEGTTLFLGGPLHFFKGLQARFKETLKLSDEEAIYPELSLYFVALGSSLYAQDEKDSFTYDELLHRMEKMNSEELHSDSVEPLFKNEEEYHEFKARHHLADVANKDLTTYHGNMYLGIDCGSTTTKVVLIDEDENILYQSYRSNLGNPIEVVEEELNLIYLQANDDAIIKGSCVTGYGEELVKNAFHIDYGVVETMAHYHAARHFNPNVDFIIDIGGQDMKCFKVKDGNIDDIILNEACSSGCGSFLETFANSMGYDIKQFASLGLMAKHPVDLGSRCTVFMNSSVKQAQKNGASIEDISAGLCISVVKNALYKVIRARSKEEIGNQIVVQGGTFLNDTVLRSFELELGSNVIRPQIAHLMGAYGCALLIKRHDLTKSSILSKQELAEFKHTSVATNCEGCTNHCALTINTFSDGSRHIAGNKCERPTLGRAQKENLPNLYDFKYNYLFNFEQKKVTRGKLGVPVVLNMFDELPFFTTLLSELGFEVVLSDPSSRALYSKGQQSITSDTACYPAKLVHGHIQSLLDKGVEAIFYPCMSYNFDEGKTSNHYNCPVVAYYPEVIAANMDLGKTKIYYPYLYLENKEKFVSSFYEYFKDKGFDISLEEVKEAATKAYKAYEDFRLAVIKEGERAYQYAKENNRKIIILTGRPYHIDPQINHGIHRLLGNLGAVVLSEDSIPQTTKMPDLKVLNQWTFHARMYQAAEFASTHKDCEVVQLVSFGCGIDAITTDEIKSILQAKGKLYTQIKIDEIDNLGAIKIRCRSLLAAMDERKEN